MSKLKCICGNQISDVVSPNEHSGILLTEQGVDELCEKEEYAFPILLSEIYERSRHTWECPKCGRLAFRYPETNSNTVKWYKPENGGNGHLLKFKVETEEN